MPEIESRLIENRVFFPDSKFSKNAKVSDMSAYEALCQSADLDYEQFWAKLAQEHLVWNKSFTSILNERTPPFYKWFEDGLLNASYNCIDRHVESGNADKTALIFESDNGETERITYKTLLAKVCKLSNALKRLGYKKGDRAIIYMPMSIEGVVAMQACARLGITHSVVFGGFSSKSLEERIVDVGARLIITADEQVRGGKRIPLKKAVDEALRGRGSTNV